MEEWRVSNEMSSEQDFTAETECVNRPKQVFIRELHGSPYSELRAVRCEFEEDRIVLVGVLPTFYLKQLAQTFARNAVCSVQIVNKIEVRYKEVATC